MVMKAMSVQQHLPQLMWTPPVYQKMCIRSTRRATVENEEKSDESARRAIEERNKDEAAVKSEKPKLKGIYMMDFLTPEQVREHIFSLRQGVGQVSSLSLFIL